jgi:hypothetical protein
LNFQIYTEPAASANGLRANEGRETNALNCKPITNLKEKYELSNYCKTSGFRLHAVILVPSHSLHQNTIHAIHASRAGFGGVSSMDVIN